MAVKLTQISRVGTPPADNDVRQAEKSELPRYDSTVTTKAADIGSAIQLDETTTIISIFEDAGTGFTWGIVTTEGASIPANSPEWKADGPADWWQVPRTPGVARWFKTAALS